jgi:DNA-binding CsgD family transcriptional regulator
VLALERGDATAARRHLGEALTAGRVAGVPRLSAFALLFLGNVALHLRDPAAARGPLAESLALYRQLGDPIYLALHLEAWGHAAALEGRPLGALRLAGAGAAVRARVALAPPPHTRRRVEAWVAEARLAVGPGPAQKAWADGEAMSLAEAVAFALVPPGPAPEAVPPVNAGTALETAPPSDRSRPEPGEQLTPREREVAALVTRGLTSREIARALVITEGTARIHVERLRAKLGVRSRAQIAAWVVAHQAAPANAPTVAPRPATDGAR